jgi:aminopeptidase N
VGSSVRVGGPERHATLHTLIGKDQFNKVVGGYYQEFANGGATNDFVAFARRAASRDLSAFFDDWLSTTCWTEVLANATTIGDLAAHCAQRSPN